MPDVWGLAASATKFVLYLGLLTAAGTVFAALLFHLKRYRGLAFGFGLVGLAAALLTFSLRAAALTGDAAGMVDPEMLGLLWQTPPGTALMFRVIGLCVLMAGLLAGRIGLWGSAAGGVLAIWSFDHVGHIAGQYGVSLDIALTLHLLAIALWIGVLTPLQRLAMDPRTLKEAAAVGHRFGQIAAIAVPVLIIAGGYMAYVLIGSIVALIGTGYGQAILIKIVLIAALLALAAANKLRFVPGMQKGDRKAAGHLAKSITVEWLIILLILATTAVLTSNLTLPT